ncbi:uncharacterized protein LOC115883100 isoform X2 [Sitophilus oryzae]|uniref:Uncharacterized protein LOC115883100 isoform X2 n=1 Tax=Sitophilus oryzae TaxID=7048 RepID=A0A6J2Y2V2_SITOR|nr:uncharacterized protein LOC115883100 isoform X2 [Sitophilus oryzae]
MVSVDNMDKKVIVVRQEPIVIKNIQNWDYNFTVNESFPEKHVSMTVDEFKPATKVINRDRSSSCQRTLLSGSSSSNGNPATAVIKGFIRPPSTNNPKDQHKSTRTSYSSQTPDASLKSNPSNQPLNLVVKGGKEQCNFEKEQVARTHVAKPLPVSFQQLVEPQRNITRVPCLDASKKMCSAQRHQQIFNMANPNVIATDSVPNEAPLIPKEGLVVDAKQNSEKPLDVGMSHKKIIEEEIEQEKNDLVTKNTMSKIYTRKYKSKSVERVNSPFNIRTAEESSNNQSDIKQVANKIVHATNNLCIKKNQIQKHIQPDCSDINVNIPAKEKIYTSLPHEFNKAYADEELRSPPKVSIISDININDKNKDILDPKKYNFYDQNLEKLKKPDSTNNMALQKYHDNINDVIGPIINVTEGNQIKDWAKNLNTQNNGNRTEEDNKNVTKTVDNIMNKQDSITYNQMPNSNNVIEEFTLFLKEFDENCLNLNGHDRLPKEVRTSKNLEQTGPKTLPILEEISSNIKQINVSKVVLSNTEQVSINQLISDGKPNVSSTNFCTIVNRKNVQHLGNPKPELRQRKNRKRSFCFSQALLKKQIWSTLKNISSCFNNIQKNNIKLRKYIQRIHLNLYLDTIDKFSIQEYIIKLERLNNIAKRKSVFQKMLMTKVCCNNTNKFSLRTNQSIFNKPAKDITNKEFDGLKNHLNGSDLEIEYNNNNGMTYLRRPQNENVSQAFKQQNKYLQNVDLSEHFYKSRETQTLTLSREGNNLSKDNVVDKGLSMNQNIKVSRCILKNKEFEMNQIVEEYNSKSPKYILRSMISTENINSAIKDKLVDNLASKLVDHRHFEEFYSQQLLLPENQHFLQQCVSEDQMQGYRQMDAKMDKRPIEVSASPENTDKENTRTKYNTRNSRGGQQLLLPESHILQRVSEGKMECNKQMNAKIEKTPILFQLLSISTSPENTDKDNTRTKYNTRHSQRGEQLLLPESQQPCVSEDKMECYKQMDAKIERRPIKVLASPENTDKENTRTRYNTRNSQREPNHADSLEIASLPTDRKNGPPKNQQKRRKHCDGSYSADKMKCNKQMDTKIENIPIEGSTSPENTDKENTRTKYNTRNSQRGSLEIVRKDGTQKNLQKRRKHCNNISDMANKSYNIKKKLKVKVPFHIDRNRLMSLRSFTKSKLL